MIIIGTIFIYFCILLLISKLTIKKGNNETFFRATRQSPWYLVAFGMIGASISGVTFVSVPGMVIEQNMTYAQTCMGFILGYVLVAFVLSFKFNNNLFISKRKIRRTKLQNRRFIFYFIQNVWSNCKILCCLYDFTTFCS